MTCIVRVKRTACAFAVAPDLLPAAARFSDELRWHFVDRIVFSDAGGRFFFFIVLQMHTSAVLMSELSSMEREPVGFTISTFDGK